VNSEALGGGGGGGGGHAWLELNWFHIIQVTSAVSSPERKVVRTRGCRQRVQQEKNRKM
jgi:hypothetical protein